LQRRWALDALLLIIGAAAAGAALWLSARRAVVPGAEVIIAFLLGACFCSWTYGLLRYLRWRDTRRVVAMAQPTCTDSDLEGTVYGLIPGSQYRVMQTFRDYYGNQFREGELLRFKERHFLPYHGGHTIIFEEQTLYLQEEVNAEILASFSRYISRSVGQI
jgi:hypothetical protein